MKSIHIRQTGGNKFTQSLTQKGKARLQKTAILESLFFFSNQMPSFTPLKEMSVKASRHSSYT